MQRKYEEIRAYSDKEIREMLERQAVEELIVLSLSAGLYHPNWKFAQDLCLKLAEHSDALVRANAILGLAHAGRVHGRLDRRIVKPVVLRELRNNEEHRGKIMDAISDMNQFLDWNLAGKHQV